MSYQNCIFCPQIFDFVGSSLDLKGDHGVNLSTSKFATLPVSFKQSQDDMAEGRLLFP